MTNAHVAVEFFLTWLTIFLCSLDSWDDGIERLVKGFLSAMMAAIVTGVTYLLFL